MTRTDVFYEGVPEHIRSARLEGRRPTVADLTYKIEIDRDWEVQKTLFGELSTPEESKQRLDRWIEMWERTGLGFWLLNRIGDPATIGHAGLFPSPHLKGQVELGYAFKPAFWGNGYATEITISLLEIAFNELGLITVVANAIPGNAASRRVLERAGFSFVRESLYGGTIPNVEYRVDRDRRGLPTRD